MNPHNPLEPSPLIYLVAGEPSGDLLGAKLMASLKAKMGGKVRFAGIGGPRMIAQGLESLFPYQELAIMGFVEILPKLPKLMGRIRQTVKDIITLQPRCVVTIDSPGFCFRVAQKIRANKYGQHLKLVHYVAPTVWAYKPERAAKISKLFDYLMVVLPFEPPYFERVGLPCSFVGHPIVDEWRLHQGDAAAFRQTYDITPETPILTMLPGSRLGELDRHLPIYTQVVQRLRFTHPNLVTAIVTPPHLVSVMKDRLSRANWPLKVILIQDDKQKRDAFAASTLALAKSGTVTLELSLAKVPLIITYKTSKITAWLLRRMLRIKYVSLISILLDKPLIPELLQEQCNPLDLTREIEALLGDARARNMQVEGAQAALALLRGTHPDSPSDQAADVVLNVMQNS